jgi:glycine cleavage system protein P-like pyridoxal-binding family
MRIRYSYQYGPPRTKPHDHMYTVQSYKNVRVWSEAYIYIYRLGPDGLERFFFVHCMMVRKKKISQVISNFRL